MRETTINILGPLECWVDGQQLRIRGVKQQTILGVLVLAEGKPVQLSRLVDAVWGEFAPPTAKKQVRNGVSNLRQMLSGASAVIVPAGDGYRLELNAARLDVSAFADLIAQARHHVRERRFAEAVAKYRRALALWRGPVLAGLENPVTLPYIAGLHEQRLTALEECIELELKVADDGPGAHTAELAALAEEHPFRERIISLLMLSLYRSGAQADALIVYEQTRRRLQEELGAMPGPELRRMHQAILRNDPSLLSSTAGVADRERAWNNLPDGPGKLIGRRTELRNILNVVRERHAESLASGKPIVIAIDGMAGIGKTAFAVHLAQELVQYYPDAQLFVDLHGHTFGRQPLSGSDALGALLSATGLRTEHIPPHVDDRLALWRRRLAGRRALIVLDNVRDTAQISPLLSGALGCLILVTSRHRLTTLNCTHQVSLYELPQSDGRELFHRLVGDDRPVAEPQAVERILRLCGGLPLAIRNAALRLRHRPVWTIGHLASRLEDVHRRLVELEAEDGGVLRAFTTSYQSLSQQTQCFLTRLGGMPEKFRMTDVAATWGLPVARTEHMIEELLRAHLLREIEPERFQLHDLLRVYLTHLRSRPRSPADTQGRCARRRVTRGPATDCRSGQFPPRARAHRR